MEESNLKNSYVKFFTILAWEFNVRRSVITGGD